MGISYTFPADCSIPELRGVTATGGELCRVDGQWMKGDPDAVRFDQPRPNGRILIARIAGKPELEAALAAVRTAKAAKEERLASMGWPEYQAARIALGNAQGAYDKSSTYGYPAREATRLRQAEEHLERIRGIYPDAAAYAKAVSFSEASNFEKAAIGRRAAQAIEGGEDPHTVIAEMEAAWQRATQTKIWD